MGKFFGTVILAALGLGIVRLGAWAAEYQTSGVRAGDIGIWIVTLFFAWWPFWLIWEMYFGEQIPLKYPQEKPRNDSEAILERAGVQARSSAASQAALFTFSFSIPQAGPYGPAPGYGDLVGAVIHTVERQGWRLENMSSTSAATGSYSTVLKTPSAWNHVDTTFNVAIEHTLVFRRRQGN